MRAETRRAGRAIALACGAAILLSAPAVAALPLDDALGSPFGSGGASTNDRTVDPTVDPTVHITAAGLVVEDPAPFGPFPSDSALDATSADALDGTFSIEMNAALGAAGSADPFSLHSRPGADLTIFLDFDGHTTVDTPWNNGTRPNSFTSEPYSRDGDPEFDALELESIARIWEVVAADYEPFDVDVTTEDPGIDGLRRSSTADEEYGQRVVISPTNTWFGNGGGIAYVGSFSWLNSDAPAFVFTGALADGHWKYVGETASHETGHTLGLLHDGSETSSYYAGHGAGENGWAPIMGVGYTQPVTQWSRGEYRGATEHQDDIGVLQAMLGAAEPTASATIGSNSTTAGSITTGGGSTEYTVEIGAGSAQLTVRPTTQSNLLAQVELLDGSDVVASAVPTRASNWLLSLSANLPAGTYRIRVTSIGWQTADDGFTNYGSVGTFTMTLDAAQPGVASTPTSGSSSTANSGPSSTASPEPTGTTANGAATSAEPDLSPARRLGATRSAASYGITPTQQP